MRGAREGGGAPPLRGGRFAPPLGGVGPVRVASLTGPAGTGGRSPSRVGVRQPVRDAGGPNSERVPRLWRETRPPSDFCRFPSRVSCPPHGSRPVRGSLTPPLRGGTRRPSVPPRRGGKRPPIYMGPVRGTPYIWEQLADLEPPFLRKGVQDLRVALHIKRPSHTALILPPAGGSAKAKRY